MFAHVVALAERGELTPTTAAGLTGLTVEEASRVLAELADKGQLRRVDQPEDQVYGLPNWEEAWG
jgi:hypothetical protein